MIKPGNVPKEAIAELRAFLNSCDCDECVSVAIAAALSAWPGMACKHYYNSLNDKPSHTEIILPLPPQENPDDKA